MSMWEPFTALARRSIVLAQEEAQGLGHRYLGAEHLLLGIVAEGDNDSAKVLVANGVDLVGLRERVKAIVLGDEAWVHPEMVFGPAAKLAIDRAFSVAREMNHNYIGADHLLLGIIDHGDNPAVRAIVAAGIDLTKVRGEVVEAMHSPREPASASRWSAFTERARRAIVLAQGEAQLLGSVDTACAHLLLGLIGERDGHAALALVALGIDLSEVRRALETRLGARTQTVVHDVLRFDLFAERALQRAHEEAKHAEQAHIGTAHLFVGLLVEGDSTVTRLFAELGVDVPAVRLQTALLTVDEG